MSKAFDSSRFSDLSYFLHLPFRSKAGFCVYFRNKLTYSRAHALEYSKHSIIWPRLLSHSLTAFIYAIYPSSNSFDYTKYFDWLFNFKVLSFYPFVEISILVGSKDHHQLWLFSSFTVQPNKLTFNFAIVPDLKQQVQLSWSFLPVIFLPMLLPYLFH